MSKHRIVLKFLRFLFQGRSGWFTGPKFQNTIVRSSADAVAGGMPSDDIDRLSVGGDSDGGGRVVMVVKSGSSSHIEAY